MAIEELFYPEVMRSTACEDTPYPILKSSILFRIKSSDIFAYISHPFDITSDDYMKCTYEDNTFLASIYEVRIYDGIPFLFRFIRVDTDSDETVFYIERLSSRGAESFEIIEKIRKNLEEKDKLIEPKRHLGITRRVINGISLQDLKDFSYIEEGIKSEYADVMNESLYTLYKIVEGRDTSLPDTLIDLLITKMSQFPLIIMGIFRQLKETENLHRKLEKVKFSEYTSDFGYQIRLARKLKSIYN